MPDALAQLQIRVAVAGDAAPLAALAARSFYDTYAAHNRPEDMTAYMTAEFGPAIQAAQIDDPAIRTLIAETGAGPADPTGATSVPKSMLAYVQLYRDEIPACVRGPSPVELRRLYVDRPWIGRGVAARMMDAAFNAARAWGGRTIWLGVWERNPRAVAFYRKCGFEHVGEVAFQFASDPQTDLAMARQLPAD